MWMIKLFFRFNTKIYYFTANFTRNKRQTYICIRVYICCAFTWPKIHTCIKYIYVNANIHLVWAGVYLHGGVYLHMCKLTFTYMQLRSHAQKYTRVQIIHIYIIYTPCVNQSMWTGLMISNMNVALNKFSVKSLHMSICQKLYNMSVKRVAFY